MAITSLADFRAALANPYCVEVLKSTTVPTTGLLYSPAITSIGTPVAYATPTSAVAPTVSTIGSMPIPAGTTNNLRCLEVDWTFGDAGGFAILCDRVSHQGGLVGNLNTTQTTNLPTAALTRYTSGEGVWAAAEIYSSVGASAAQITTSYTNQAGTPGRISRGVTIGSSAFNTPGRFQILTPQNGDTGFRSVESVILSVTTGTAGNFGITLFKPLVLLATDLQRRKTTLNALVSGGLQLEEIQPNASLFFLFIREASGQPNFIFKFAEDA